MAAFFGIDRTYFDEIDEEKRNELIQKAMYFYQKDGRLVDFGYVYMFYMSDVKKETLMSRIDNKTNELLRGLSDELNSIFDGVEMNDMKCWGTAS